MQFTYSLYSKANVDTDNLHKVYVKTLSYFTEEELKGHLSMRISVARKLGFTVRYTEQGGITALIIEHYFRNHIFEREIYQYPTFK